MQIVPKKTNKKICLGLTWREYKCQCSYKECVISIIHPDLENAYYQLRTALNTPLHITSGYRCPRHNHSKKVNGWHKSKHKAGMAIDIAYTGKITEWKPEELDALALRCGFSRTIYYKYKKFFHLEV